MNNSSANPTQRRHHRAYACARAALFSLLAAKAPAATLYWDGDGTGTVGGGAGVWSTSFAGWGTSATGNTYQVWNNAASPADDAWFANTAGAVTLAEPITVRSITSRVNGYSLAGSTLTLADGTGIFDIGTASTVIFTVNAEIAGSNGLTKTGLGQLTLGAANTFTGGATLTQGTVNIGHDLALSSGVVTLNGGAIAAFGAPRTLANAVTLAASSTVSGSQALTFSGAVTLTGNRTLTVSNSALTTLAGGIAESGGARNFTKAGNGNLLLSAPSTYTGTTTISAGTLALGPAGTLSAANLALSGGVLALGSDFTRALGTGAGQVRFTNNGGFAAYGGPVNITGFVGTPVWGSTAGFLATGRTLILGSAIANDVVTWTNDFSLGSSARVITANDNTASTVDRAVISGVISSAAGGALTKTGAGRLDLTAANTYSGPTLLQQGVTGVATLANVGSGPSSLGAPATAGEGVIGLGSTTSAATLLYLGSGSVTDRVLNLAGTTGGATLQNDGTGALVFTGGVTATGAGSKTLVLAGANTGANELGGVVANHSATHVTRVTKSGVGVWELSGANTYTGGTTLSVGTLVAGSDTAFGTGTLTLSGSGATLRADASPRTLANSVTLSANVTIGGSSDLTFTGAISQSGSRTLTVSNTGLTTFSGPALTLAENNQARTLTLAPAAGSTLLVSALVRDGTGTGADRLTKSGAGTLVLSGANTYTGGTTLSAGTLVAGSDTAFGTGTLTLSGTGATLRADASPRTLANSVALSANVTIGGASDLTFTGPLALGTTTRTLTVANTGLTTFSGVASGTAGLVKTGAGVLALSGLNTFTGAVSVPAGVLSVNSLANLSTASALGAPTTSTNGLIALGSTTSSGTLRYTGSGHSTNRAINLAGTTGGGVLQADGSGPLVFTSAFSATGAGSKTLVLSGSNTGANTLSGAIVNNSATHRTTVRKQGAGTWVLSGANTFTGGLVVEAGTLRLGADNTLADTLPVTLSGGAFEVSGRSETAGVLAVTGSAVIDFGASAAAIVFAASNSTSWAGATLTIANYTVGTDTLRFGTNASALTSTQLASFRFVDQGNVSARIDAFGFVSPVPEPAALGALAGVAALLFSVARRPSRRPGASA